jgi:hypothetical protein
VACSWTRDAWRTEDVVDLQAARATVGESEALLRRYAQRVVHGPHLRLYAGKRLAVDRVGAELTPAPPAPRDGQGLHPAVRSASRKQR